MAESIRVIGFQARVHAESYEFQTFPISFWLQVHHGPSVAIGLPVDLQWL